MGEKLRLVLCFVILPALALAQQKPDDVWLRQVEGRQQKPDDVWLRQVEGRQKKPENDIWLRQVEGRQKKPEDDIWLRQVEGRQQKPEDDIWLRQVEGRNAKNAPIAPAPLSPNPMTGRQDNGFRKPAGRQGCIDEAICTKCAELTGSTGSGGYEECCADVSGAFGWCEKIVNTPARQGCINEDICSKCVEITGGGDLGKEECCTDTPSGTFRTCEQLVNAPAKQNPVLPHGLFPTPSPIARDHVTPDMTRQDDGFRGDNGFRGDDPFRLKGKQGCLDEGICQACVDITGGGDLGKEECCTDTPSGTFRTCEQLVNAPQARQDEFRKQSGLRQGNGRQDDPFRLKGKQGCLDEGICQACVDITGGGDLGKEECCTDTPSGTFRTCEQLVNAPQARQDEFRKQSGLRQGNGRQNGSHCKSLKCP